MFPIAIVLSTQQLMGIWQQFRGTAATRIASLNTSLHIYIPLLILISFLIFVYIPLLISITLLIYLYIIVLVYTGFECGTQTYFSRKIRLN